MFEQQISKMTQEEYEEYYKELEDSKNSYEARKNFYLKKNKILESIDNKFHSALLQKQGTFYKSFKDYNSEPLLEKKVIIGSKDFSWHNSDLFEYEKLDSKLTSSTKIISRKVAKTVNLQDSKDAHQFDIKSLNISNFVTPFQSQV